MAAIKKWDLEPDNTIKVLDGGKSEEELTSHLYRFDRDLLVEFYEPDLRNQLTGFAIKPGHSPDWLIELPLILRGGEK